MIAAKEGRCEYCGRDDAYYQLFMKYIDNEDSLLTIHILRNWDRTKIEGFAKHLLGSQE